MSYVPSSRSISNDAVVIVHSRVTRTKATHCLARNGRTVVVETYFGSPDLNDEEFNTKPTTLDKALSYNSRPEAWHNKIVETLYPLLDRIEFEKYNCATLVEDGDGYKIVGRPRSFHRLFKAPIWTRRILLEEVEITRWNALAAANGYWNGKPVDITYAWEREPMTWVNNATTAAYHLQDLDVTYETYGHLIDSDGNIIGLVTEAAWGRQIEAGDRGAVYAAIAAIQRKGCIFCGRMASILVAGDKVRIGDLIPVAYYPPDQRGAEFEREAEIRHWETLDEHFLNMDDPTKIDWPFFQFFRTAFICMQVPPALLKSVRRPLALLRIPAAPPSIIFSEDASSVHVPRDTISVSTWVSNIEKYCGGKLYQPWYITDGAHQWFLQVPKQGGQRIDSENRGSSTRGNRNRRRLRPYQLKEKQLPPVDCDRTSGSYIEEVS